jgi:hypothetical protein
VLPSRHRLPVPASWFTIPKSFSGCSAIPTAGSPLAAIDDDEVSAPQAGSGVEDGELHSSDAADLVAVGVVGERANRRVVDDAVSRIVGRGGPLRCVKGIGGESL